MVMSSTGLWVAVESARDCGDCFGRRLVRVRVESGMWHGEGRDGSSGEWRAIAEPVLKGSRFAHSCALVGSLLYVVGGRLDGK